MSLPLLARTSARQAITRARTLHTTAPVRDAHGHYHVCLCLMLFTSNPNL